MSEMEENAKRKKIEDIRIEKVTLSIGGKGEELEKGVKLLERLTGQKAARRKSKKRIPTLEVRPGLEVGCLVTLRRQKAEEILRKLLAAVDNKIKEKQITEGSFSFGIKEYIEIPGMQYQRDIGVLGFDVSVSFCKPGKRVSVRKIKRSDLPKKQIPSKEEIIKFLTNKFQVEIIRRKK